MCGSVVLLCEAMRVCCDQCARGHPGPGHHGHGEMCEGGCLGMHVCCGEVVCVICDVAPQDVAMPVELEHESGGSREAAQVLHALNRELVYDAAPKMSLCCASTSTSAFASIGSLPA